MTNLSLYIAFTAGVLSFFSPCVLTLFPSYLSYITGLTIKDFENDRRQNKIRKIALLHSIFFILGFSFLFMLMGSAINALSNLLIQYRDVVRLFGGIVIIAFGLFILGIFKIPILNFEKKFDFQKKPKGYFGSFLIGIIFSAGWTPCVGPILGSILILAGTKETIFKGMSLLGAYSLGMAVPFLVSTLLISSFLKNFKNISKHIYLINIVCGVFLIVVGVLLLTNYFNL